MPLAGRAKIAVAEVLHFRQAIGFSVGTPPIRTEVPGAAASLACAWYPSVALVCQLHTLPMFTTAVLSRAACFPVPPNRIDALPCQDS